MNKFKKAIILAAVLLTSISCAQQDQSNSITMEKFKEKLKSDKELIILDVRTPEEVAAGKIENSINIPVQVLEERLNELEKFKGKEIFVLCRTQNRSSAAQDILKKNGYNAKYVIGGMSVYNQK